MCCTNVEKMQLHLVTCDVQHEKISCSFLHYFLEKSILVCQDLYSKISKSITYANNVNLPHRNYNSITKLCHQSWLNTFSVKITNNSSFNFLLLMILLVLLEYFVDFLSKNIENTFSMFRDCSSFFLSKL